MKLLWHVIKKDLAALRWWLFAWAAACFVHFALRVVQLHWGEEALPGCFAVTTRPDFVALILLLVLIVPQIIQLDPPGPGGAFWKTVPLSRQRVILAKSLLIAAGFIVFPFLLEAIYFVTAGFGATAWSALGMWLLRMLPLVFILAGAAAFARDRRLAALLIGSIGLLLWQSGLSGVLTTPQTPYLPPRIVTPVYLWSGPTACWLATAFLVLLFTQYWLRGRFAWTIALAALAINYPLRTKLFPLPEKPIADSQLWTWLSHLYHGPAAPAPRPFAAREVSAQPPPVERGAELMKLPAGMSITIDPIPSYTAFVDTKHSGQVCYFGIRVAMEGAPEGVAAAEVQFVDCKLVLPDKTLLPAPVAEAEMNYRSIWIAVPGPQTLSALAGMKSGSRICVPTPSFDASRTLLETQPARLEGRIRLKFIHIASAGSVALRPSLVWQRELSNLRIGSALRGDLGSPGQGDGVAVHFRFTTTTVGAPGEARRVPEDPSRTRVLLCNDLLGFEESEADLSGSGPVQLKSLGFQAVPSISEVTDVTRERHWEWPEAAVSIDSLARSGQLTGYRARQFYSEEADLGHWRLALERSESLGEIEIPVRLGPVSPAPIPWSSAQASRNGGNYQDRESRLVRAERSSRAFRKALDEIQLGDPGKPADVEEYLQRLAVLLAFTPQELSNLYRNEILLKISAVGAENLESLLRIAEGLSAPEALRAYGISYNSDSAIDLHSEIALTEDLRRVICDLARDQDKALILRRLSPHLDLLDAVEEHGWTADAATLINQYAQAETIPERWLHFLADSRDRRLFDGILAQIRHGECTADFILKRCREIGIPDRELAEAAWQGVVLPPNNSQLGGFGGRGMAWENQLPNAATEQPFEMLRLFGFACSAGVETMPQRLLLFLQMTRNDWQRQAPFIQNGEDLPSIMLRVFCRYSDCPAEIGEARSWLTSHADRLQFNNATRRYELR